MKRCNNRIADVAIANRSDEAFSLLEVVLAVGLLTLALSASYMILLSTERAQVRLVRRSALNSVLNNIVADLRAGTTYADPTNADFAAGNTDHAFSYDGGGRLGVLQCIENTLGSAGTFVTVHCTTGDGVAVERIIRVPSGVPVPGSVLTPPPKY